MRTLLIAIIASICWLAPSYGQNSGKSAKEVWAAYNANPSDMYIFLDGLAESNNPQEYRRYMQEFVSTCVDRGVSLDVLLDEMKETVLPKGADVAATFGASLCKLLDLSGIRKVMQIFPKNCSFDNMYVSDVVVYPGGQILLKGDDKVSLADFRNLLESYCYLVPNQSKPQYKQYQELLSCQPLLLFQPDGTMQAGIFKCKGTNTPLSSLSAAKENDDLELYAGYKYDKDGNEIGSHWLQFDSFEKFSASIKKSNTAAKSEGSAAFDRVQAQQKARLIKRYGVKAYNAMENARPYVGMPEGILREFGYFSPSSNGDRNNNSFFNAYAFSHTNISGYKVYKATFRYLAVTNAVHINTPQYILCSGGRVSAIKW